MKHTKSVVLTIILVLSAFVAVIYSSCKKDKCKGVDCKNTSICKDGLCVCPTGYSGKFCELSTIVFLNSTFTPLSLTVSSTKVTLQPDSTFTFTDTAGRGAAVSANTQGTTPAGKQIGKYISWSFNDTLPKNGASHADTFNVNPGLFFLKIQNENHFDTLTVLYVNYQDPNYQTYDTVNIPNNGHSYGIGYFVRNPGTRVYGISFAGSYTWLWDPTIPYTINASATVTAY